MGRVPEIARTLTSPAVLAASLRQSKATATRLARIPAIPQIREGLDLGNIPRTFYRFELQDGENISNLQEKPRSPPVPRDRLAPDAPVHVRPPSLARPGPFPLPPPTLATPCPPCPLLPQKPPPHPRSGHLVSSLRHPPTGAARQVPQHPYIGVGVSPPSPLALSPLSLGPRRRAGKRRRARLRVRPGGAGRGGRGGAGRGCGTRSALGSPPRRRQRRREARPARGSAESSPVASKSGCATVKSPTFLEPLERHLSGGGWGVFFQVSQQGALCGPSSPGRASRLSAPPPPNDQLPATLLPGAARGWLAAARKQQPGSLLHDN